MKVPGKPRRLEIDFVRGIAILLVMADHFHKPVTGIYPLDAFSNAVGAGGGHGVDLFFVLSGYLVGGLLLREYRDTGTLKPGRFLLRRMFKIWPAYYFLIFFQLFARRHPPSTFFWQNFFHLQNYLGSSIVQTWSLGVEEHFYLFLALLLGFVAQRHWDAKRILNMLLILSVAAFVTRTVVGGLGHTWEALRHSELRMDSLLFGVMISLLYHFMPDLYRRLTLRAWPLILLTLVGIYWGRVSGDDWVVKGHYRGALYGPTYALFYITSGAFMILCLEHSGKLPKLWIYRAISVVGVYSYGLYLWHSAVFGVGDKIAGHFNPVPAFFLALAAQFVAACAIAYVTTRLIEWPALYWRESIQWLRDSKPLAQSPDQQGSHSEGAGGNHERGAEAVLVSK